MLDILRKHASSWVIKIILAAIVISFVFFFGYSTMRSSRPGASSEVATVNGKPISVAEYKFMLDNTYERLKSQFSGKDVPEFVLRMARAQTLRSLVSRELGLSLARKLGVVIPDAELAALVTKTPYAQRDGEFDPIFYRHQFLPYFKQRFGLDFESFIRQDLELEALESIFRSVDRDIPEGAPDDGVELKWTFESIELDPEKLVGDGKVNTPEEVRSAAELIIASEPKRWRGLAAPLGVEVVKTGPITVKDRKRLLGGAGTAEDLVEIFSLTAESPVIEKPIERDGKIYVVRLVEREEIDMSENFWPARNFFRSWMAKLTEKAEVVSYLNEEE